MEVKVGEHTICSGDLIFTLISNMFTKQDN